MTQEKELHQFLGVACLHCGTPIPVPAIIGTIEAALRAGAKSSPGNSAVFTLRCPVCHKEKPYRTREIVNFDRSSQAVTPLAQPESVRLRKQGEMTRAAKA
jgi:hypothetical protein